MSKIVITWPESQMLFELKGFSENCSLINGEVGLRVYGSSAYLVDEEWYNSDEDEYEEDEYEEDDEYNELDICYDNELRSLGFLSDDDFENNEYESDDDEDENDEE